ncbi:hypothetical protein N656DRAFT_834835 [Canariomyces notabilis]|uniref:Uncharacterized protein n=1 Tax=Canariomyces notabilis TaxID=2074819 RepID=A0AAN6TJL6_9PEZI|nr:hypothetical protein N656DRAFT_834835 [Canariomyces arenarius]
MDEEHTITLNLGSSPDPLIDPALSPPMMPPSAIKARSPAAKRLYTLESSPRKQTFELDVGNEMSPQRLLVTVEADEPNRNTNRRLFQSPTPKRGKTPQRVKTVTTSVPVRGLTDDESTTPKRRGRPRKSGGTPIPSRRKRPGTPAKAPRGGADRLNSPQKGVLTSDIEDMQPTPRPTTQPKRVAKRKSTSPTKEDSAPGTQAKKRGRPRKRQITSDDLATHLGQEQTDNAASVPTPVHTRGAAAENQGRDDMDDDIWLATLSDQPTPAGQTRQKDHGPAFTSDASDIPQSELQRHEPEQQPQYEWPELGGGMDSYSEAESQASEDRDGQDRQDTVMPDEEFTMISLSTLPSMQPNSSVMAPEPEEFGEATRSIINRSLEYLRQSWNRAAEEPAAEHPVTETAEGEAGGEELAGRNSNQQHDEHILPPPPPSQSPQTLRRSPRRAKAQPLARQIAQKTLQQEAHQSPAPHQPAVDQSENRDASAYDDSFSEIPEDVLIAATPRQFRQPRRGAEAEQESDKPSREDIQPSIERPSTVNHSNPQSETNRLLTPDETPSPIPSETEEHNAQTKSPSPGPALGADMPSSPPIGSPAAQTRFTSSIARHLRANSTETPADQLSSFASTTMAARDAQPVLLPLPEPQPRPSLSPIVRAGRALQLVTSDPPSPPGRDSMLGSPFRGSTTKSSQSPAPALATEQPPSRATRSPSLPQTGAAVDQPQSNFVVQSAQSLSPARISVSGTEGMDDPRGSVRSTLFSGPGKQAFDRDPTVSVASPAARNSPHDDDPMSWQGEGSVAEGSQRSASPSLSVHDARGSTGVEREPTGHQEEQAQNPESSIGARISQWSANMAEHTREEEEMDERPTPHALKTAPRRQEEPPAELPARGKIPSPWRKNSRRLVYNDELQKYAEKGAPTEWNPSVNEDEEYSMLAQGQEQRPPVPSRQPPQKKGDFSSFFSSPATLPDMQGPPGLGSSKTLDSRRPAVMDRSTQRPRSLLAAQQPPTSGNTLFSHYLQPSAPTRVPSVPQKQLEIGGRRRSIDLFSPRKSSPEHRDTGKAPAPPQQKQLKLDDRQRNVGVLSPGRSSSEPKTAAQTSAPPPALHPASPESSEAPRAAIIPQKKNFTPRRRQPGDTSSLFQREPAAPSNSLFSNNKVSEFFSQARQQTVSQSRAEEQRQETPVSEEEDSSFIPPVLKPLPDRAASPSKSCIRSPLKPKTPGRVVEWTSSTLSPLAQAQARAERQAAGLPARGQPSQGVGRSSSRNAAVLEQQQEEVAEEEMADEEPPSSPQSQRQDQQHHQHHAPPPTNVTTRSTTTTTHHPTTHLHTPLLSPTTWTRAHWERLDALLQARKKGPLPPPFTSSSSSTSFAAQQQLNHRRRLLLGKQVVAQGESMLLEAWHLDVVDAFKAEVEAEAAVRVGVGVRVAWDETELAKRVFALLVGEERRRLGLVGRRRRW